MTPARLSSPARTLGLGLAALSPFLLSACGSTEVVAAPVLAGGTATTCQQLIADLPQEILGVSMHSSTNDSQVQWGDPSLMLTCGVPQSTDVEAWSACSVFDGVQWYINPKQTEDPGSDVTLETLGTDPIVRLDVPRDVRSQFDAVVAEIAPALTEHLRVVNRCQ